MLLTTGAVPDGDAWALEVKWDGCRAQVRYDGHSVTLRTRTGRECSADFPELAEIAGVLGKHRVTLDAELVCLRQDGRPDFGRLRRRLTRSAARRHPAMLQVFDVLHSDGLSTRALPYAERRRYLPGRRTTSWVKHKARREEQLAVTGLRRTRAGAVEAIFVARRHPDGSFTGAGSI
jgi:bifunctional non-homologous end joining protein LigD